MKDSLKTVNDSLDAIKTLPTIISLMNNIKTNQENNENTKINQENSDNTKINQENNDNTKKSAFLNELKKAKPVITPVCKDKESFQCSVPLSKQTYRDNNYNRKNKIEQYFECFNFENINYPLKKGGL